MYVFYRDRDKRQNDFKKMKKYKKNIKTKKSKKTIKNTKTKKSKRKKKNSRFNQISIIQKNIVIASNSYQRKVKNPAGE